MTMIATVAVITAYAGRYVFQPLYCDRGEGLIYDCARPAWVALDVNEFTSGRARCGDLIRVEFEDGQVLQAPALDAGTFRGYYVEDWPDLPILVDVPMCHAPFDGLSAVGKVTNVSAWHRGRMKPAEWR